MKKYYFALVLTLFVLPFFAQNIPSYVPKDGLVAWYPFNGNANDESGNGNHGINYGATLTYDKNGVANSAYSFNGNEQYILTNEINKTIQDKTFSAWVKLSTLSQGGGGIVGLQSEGGAIFDAMVYNEQNGGWFFGSEGFTRSSNSYQFEKDTSWIHMVYTYKNNDFKMYRNGVLFYKDSNYTNNIFQNGTFIGIGMRHKWGGNNYINATIDDVSLYNRVLSEKEILGIYNNTQITQNIPANIPKDGLVAWYPFNGNANDESGNGNHGINYGATLTYDKNGVANSAYSFNGNEQYILTNEINKTIQDKTFSAWVKLSTLSQGGGGIVGLQSEGGAIFDAMVYNEQNGGWFFGSDNFTRSSNSYQFEKDTSWIHMVYTYKNNDFKMYRNGVLFYKDSNYTNNIFQNGTFIGIGMRHKWGGNNYINATIDDVSLYNRVLSEKEIKLLFKTCSHEKASSNSHNTLLLKSGYPIELAATPAGGTFTSAAIKDGKFDPTTAKIGLNKIKYAYKNSQGCDDITEFQVIVADTAGTKCTKIDTVIVTKTKYDTVTVTNNITKYDTITIQNTITDTVSILKFKIKLTTGIKVNQVTQLSVYPNPTSDVLIIETTDLAALQGYRIALVDLAGKEIQNIPFTAIKTELDVKKILAKGMYVLHILDEKNVRIQTTQIIIE